VINSRGRESLPRSLPAMAEEIFENRSFVAVPTKELSPSEMTPLVNDGFVQASVRERVLSSQSMVGWERIGSDDEVDNEVILIL